ncbi:MAG: 50S ribosomal protein L6 [Magnetococcales bacterium]|nr:50S ribosomal protein L6 [Magnetococcales bacterium]
MSRIGKKIIPVPAGVEVTIENQIVTVKGKRGVLNREFHPDVEVSQGDAQLTVHPRRQDKEVWAVWGLSRSLLANMVQGVSQGFTKNLEIQGVGYRAAVAGSSLKLSLGYSHEIDYPIPAGIAIAVEKNVAISVSGADRELVGQTCAEIRAMREPEPYKGKGVRYAGEAVFRKEGKKKKK